MTSQIKSRIEYFIQSDNIFVLFYLELDGKIVSVTILGLNNI